MLWSDAPDIYTVEAAYKNMATVKGSKLQVLRDIEIAEDGLKEKSPRNPSARRMELSELHDELTALSIREVALEQDLKFLNLRVEMYRAHTYRK